MEKEEQTKKDESTNKTDTEGTEDDKALAADGKPLSDYDKALALVERREKATEAEREVLEEKKKLAANQMVGGTVGGRVEPTVAKRLTDEEYAESMQKGEVDPFKEDGYS